ncbi:hypothetical protein [uncultured Polaribacter sp.]|uniref:hypothetical protein n=1 Tax=uncultured Polaribacter sp. TaxID=174711 RepID=UPI002639372F|nr:hypothetical protein [uncultured Polaribacter sp.]
MIKKILTTTLLVFSLAIVAQPNNLKTISGFITFKDKPLPYVAVKELNSNKIVFTNAKGFYEIKTSVGKTLEYNHIGFKTIAIYIEDLTSTLNLKLAQNDANHKLNKNNSLKLGGSKIGAKNLDLYVTKIKLDSLNTNAFSVTDAILEQVSFLHTKQNQYKENLLYVKENELNGPIKWSIDGYLYDIPLPLFIEEIKEVYLIKPFYQNFIVKIKTNINYRKVKNINFNNAYFSDEDFYQNDAIPYQKLKTFLPKYLKEFKKTKNVDEILETFNKQDKKHQANYLFTVLNFLSKETKDKENILMLLKNYSEHVKNNAEELKRIAYKYDALKEYNKALNLYKQVATLRPNYKQSYRDLAQSYLNLNQFKNFWMIYKLYFKNGLKIENDDIGDMITSEIKTTYTKDSLNNAAKIKIADAKKVKNYDVRMVFEWNTSDAEFILEFVNENGEIFNLENSISENNELYNHQKKNGYTAKEIVIEQLANTNLLVNFTYLGNHKYSPTTLKVTTYFNWGKKLESKKIKVFDFGIENKKINLLDFRKL